MNKTIYKIGMVSLLALILFTLPLWNVQEIMITGNAQYTHEEIKEAIGYTKGRHILSYNKNKMKEAIKELSYIERVAINYTFPNNINIDIVERRPVGYLPFLDTLLCIDEEGTVLKQVQTKQEQLPIIEGIGFESFAVGEKVQTTNQVQLNALKEIIFYLTKYEFVDKVEAVQLTNLEQIHLYVNKLDVIIGSMRDFDKKVKWLVEIHTDFPMGILDLSLIKYDQAVLKPLN